MSVCAFPFLNANNFWNNGDTKIIKIVTESKNWSESHDIKIFLFIENSIYLFIETFVNRKKNIKLRKTYIAA